ncbi:MAG: shikimate dehydrogenase family protein [Sediminibacterium sp.]
MRQFGLIGFPLSHSFSKGYFSNYFSTENILDAQYENYPIESIDTFKSLWENNPSLLGLNVTIPYKKLVIPFLQHPSSVVQSIQACNCIQLYDGALYGYNTDVIGFEKSLLPSLKPHHQKALIFGTGGAAAAVAWVLQKLGIAYQLVSRTASEGCIAYESLSPEVIEAHTLLIQTSPVGMFPNEDEAPNLPYEAITSKHHLYDLIYNPAETKFLTMGAAQGATTQNGLEMLHLQADASWEIWNSETPFQQ